MEKVRVKTFTVAMVMLVATTALGGGKGSPTFTNSFINGRGWLKLSETCRSVYLTGLINGQQQAFAWMKEDKFARELFVETYIPRLTMGEIAKGIDLIYADPANLNVPVIDALEVFKMRVDGKSQDEIRETIEDSRKRAHEVLEEKERGH